MTMDRHSWLHACDWVMAAVATLLTCLHARCCNQPQAMGKRYCKWMLDPSDFYIAWLFSRLAAYKSKACAFEPIEGGNQ
jgi:hypothetical protein